jgi:hypothetical protein
MSVFASNSSTSAAFLPVTAEARQLAAIVTTRGAVRTRFTGTGLQSDNAIYVRAASAK